MDKKLLQQLVTISYKNGILQETVVEDIAKRLSRKELKAYIRAIKAHEKKNTVLISAPELMEKIAGIQNLFTGKNIVYDQDPSLLLGVRIQNNDMIYDMSLRSRFESMLSNLDE